MGWSRRELYLADREAGGEVPAFAPIAIPEGDAIYEAAVYDDHLLVRTNDGAPTYALYRVDPTRPARENWQLLIPAGADVIVEFAEVADQIVVHALRDARSVLLRYSRDGALLGEVALPLLGTVSDPLGRPPRRRALLSLHVFHAPREHSCASTRRPPCSRLGPRSPRRSIPPSSSSSKSKRAPKTARSSRCSSCTGARSAARRLGAGDGARWLRRLQHQPAAGVERRSRYALSVAAASRCWRTCAGAANTARRGTAPACSRASKTSSTTSTPSPST